MPYLVYKLLETDACACCRLTSHSWSSDVETRCTDKVSVLYRNAGVSNAFQVDLHALHVDEALNSLEATIKDLQRFKCKLIGTATRLCCLVSVPCAAVHTAL